MIEGLEALWYAKSNKRFPTYVLMQKVWNKVRMMQGVTGYTKYSPIWDNLHYREIAKIPYGSRWKQHGISLMSHIVRAGRLRPFAELRADFQLPTSMHFYYLQLKHAFEAQREDDIWAMDVAPVFNYLSDVSSYKGFISSCYAAKPLLTGCPSQGGGAVGTGCRSV